MRSPRLRTFRHHLRLAINLSMAAGIVNSCGVFAFKVLTTNVTGHFAFFAEAMVRQQPRFALYLLIFILTFLFGSFVSNLLMELTRHRQSKRATFWPLALEVLLLSTVATLGNRYLSPDAGAFVLSPVGTALTEKGLWMCFLLLFAMGLQNSMVTHVSRSVVRTTHLTGLLTDLGIDLSQLLTHPDAPDKALRQKNLWLKLAIIGFFSVGCVLGGYLFQFYGLQTLWLAVGFLLLAFLYDNFKYYYYRWRRQRRTLRTRQNRPNRSLTDHLRPGRNGWLWLCGLSLTGYGQDRYAPHGALHTPKGRLHLLVLYVHFADDTLDHPRWPADQIPDFARDDSLGNNDLFSREPAQIGQRENLSDWFHEMSGGQFVVTAHVHQRPVYVGTRAPAPTQRISFGPAARQALAHVRDSLALNWAAFDQRQNRPNYAFDNRDTTAHPPDGELDYVLMFFRRQYTSAHSAGVANLFASVDLPGGYRIGTGFTSTESGTSPPHVRLFMLHELAHQLYDCPHYGGANHAVGPHFYTSGGWGMMNNAAPTFGTLNAWERWWLGWSEVQTATLYENREYTIQDFMTDGDALRIPLPHAPGQFVWLENHQLRHRYDDKVFYKEVPLQPGLYAYVTARGHDRTQPREVAIRDEHTNFIKFLSASGNHDFVMDGQTSEGWPIFARTRPNPIAGENDTGYLRYVEDPAAMQMAHSPHFNGGRTRNSVRGLVAERVGDTVRWTGNAGHPDLAWHRVGDQLGFGTPTPLLNYPRYDAQQQRLGLYLLNGLRITLTAYDATTGAYRVAVRYDATDLQGDHRWTGDMRLRPVPNQPYALHLTPGTTLRLDRSGTSNRHTARAPGDFVNPTELVVDSGATLRVGRGATLRVENGSTLRLSSGARLELVRGATLAVADSSAVVVGTGAAVQRHRRARLQFAPAAQWVAE